MRVQQGRKLPGSFLPSFLPGRDALEGFRPPDTPQLTKTPIGAQRLFNVGLGHQLRRPRGAGGEVSVG
jgi:hypothetical protein